MSPGQAQARFRLALGLFIAGLVASGLTAFPLRSELDLAVRLFGWDPATAGQPGLSGWLLTVRHGLEDSDRRYPWLAYGTDWLAFGHLAIALFFIEPWLRPATGRPVIRAGVAACLGVIPTACLCGGARGIPPFWRLVDCSFGIIGVVPLLYCLRLVPHLDPHRGSSPGQAASAGA
jgi:hypothetical protein